MARTKENFPALGGSSTSADGGGVNTAKMQQQPISAMLKKKPTSGTGAVPRSPSTKNVPSTSSGMVIHVSNRPATNNINPGPAKKPSAMDFPALPLGKTKKGKSAALNEDMSSSGLQLPVSTVAAKHRTLVDDYVSVANPANFQKIQMVQKEELEAKARKEAEARSAPKLTSQDFPSLGGPATARSSAAPANTWVKAVVNEKRQKELENRKNKVAPAPLLPTKTNNYAVTPKPTAPVLTNGNANNIANNKKDKKAKEKKTKEPNNNNNSNNNNENKATNNNVNSNNNQKPSSPQRSPQPKKTPPEEHHSNVTVNSVAKSPNNLTFTSSLGESYSILPAHTFTPPTDAILRNQVWTINLQKYRN